MGEMRKDTTPQGLDKILDIVNSPSFLEDITWFFLKLFHAQEYSDISRPVEFYFFRDPLGRRRV